jgi:HAD superfamily hydrolase (TIGR01459 family)
MTPTTLAALAARYDAFLIDQFGVLMDGRGAYPGAAQALARLASTGKPIVLLSNSGKRSTPNEARLERLGFARDTFRTVLSSGEVAYQLLAARGLAAGTRVWWHARDGDHSVVDGLRLVLVNTPAEADLLLLAASRADEMSLEAYRALLAPAAHAQVPMMCLNPDLEMLTSVGKRPGAGHIATLYAGLGGPVEWVGKPHAALYAAAAALLPGISADRIVCVGDSPAHDVVGGRAAGHATALVRTGIHSDEDDTAVLALCRALGVLPDHLLPRFDWPEA